MNPSHQKNASGRLKLSTNVCAPLGPHNILIDMHYNFFVNLQSLYSIYDCQMRSVEYNIENIIYPIKSYRHYDYWVPLQQIFTKKKASIMQSPGQGI